MDGIMDEIRDAEKGAGKQRLCRLNAGAFYVWLKKKNLKIGHVARLLGLDGDKLKTMLKNHRGLDREKTKILINFAGAEDAFYMIDFDSEKERREVYMRVFLEDMPEDRHG